MGTCDFESEETKMNDLYHYLTKATVTGDDNHVLFTLTFLLHKENEFFTEIDPDTSVADLYSESFDRINMANVLTIMQFIVGRGIPDDFTKETWTIREVASRIRALPVMSSEEFRARLITTKELAVTRMLIMRLRESGSL